LDKGCGSIFVLFFGNVEILEKSQISTFRMTLHSNTIWIFFFKDGMGTGVWQFENRCPPLHPQYCRSQNISPPPRPRYCRSQNIRQPSPVFSILSSETSDSTWELASDLGSSSPTPSLPLCSDCEPTRATRYICDFHRFFFVLGGPLHRESIVVCFSNLPLLIADPPLLCLRSLPYTYQGCLTLVATYTRTGPDGPAICEHGLFYAFSSQPGRLHWINFFLHWVNFFSLLILLFLM
jgi:hypothetical protein